MKTYLKIARIIPAIDQVKNLGSESKHLTIFKQIKQSGPEIKQITMDHEDNCIHIQTSINGTIYIYKVVPEWEHIAINYSVPTHEPQFKNCGNQECMYSDCSRCRIGACLENRQVELYKWLTKEYCDAN